MRAGAAALTRSRTSRVSRNGPEVVRGHHVVEALGGERRLRVVDAGVVDEHIDGVVAVDQLVSGAAHGLQVREVAADHVGRQPWHRVAQLGDGRRALVLVAAHDREPCSLAGQLQRSRLADPRRGPGDHDPSVANSSLHDVLAFQSFGLVRSTIMTLVCPGSRRRRRARTLRSRPGRWTGRSSTGRTDRSHARADGAHDPSRARRVPTGPGSAA